LAGRPPPAALQWGKDSVVVIEQASMTITIVQTWNLSNTKFNRWLDVYMMMKRPPNINTSGILGRTLPRVAKEDGQP
jgi:hypothetical protein